MATKLHYWEINGYAEHIRYILHYGGVEFEDVRHDRSEWHKHRETFAPFGQLPLYEEAGKGSMNQSLAIARYVGHKLNLVLGDPFKDAQLDAMALSIYDLFDKARPVFGAKDSAAREPAIKTFLTESVPFYMSRFEKQVKENQGFFFGKLTWVDFVLVGVIECLNLFLDYSVEESYPNVKALIQKIHSFPGVKKYVASRKPYVSPFKGS